MKCYIQCFQLNELYSQEQADAQNEGKPSSDNIQYHWEDDMSISSSVSDVKELNNSKYILQGTFADGNDFTFSVPKMRLFEITSSDAPICYVGASESILHSVDLLKEDDGFKITIILKDLEPMANPSPGVYIASKEFPKDLTR